MLLSNFDQWCIKIYYWVVLSGLLTPSYTISDSCIQINRLDTITIIHHVPEEWHNTHVQEWLMGNENWRWSWSGRPAQSLLTLSLRLPEILQEAEGSRWRSAEGNSVCAYRSVWERASFSHCVLYLVLPLQTENQNNNNNTSTFHPLTDSYEHNQVNRSHTKLTIWSQYIKPRRNDKTYCLHIMSN